MGFLKTCCVYVLLPILISFGMFLYLQLPDFSGTVSINRNYNPITIKRDDFGIPTIESKTFKDTLYGLGYAQVQDRTWQIYVKKMLTSGRLSEVLGERTLEMDKFMRTLSLERYSNYSLEFMDSETKSLIQALVDGINDGAANLKVLPLEFWITGSKWENYTVLDSLGAVKLISIAMSVDGPYELLSEMLADLYGSLKSDFLMPFKSQDLFWNTTTMSDQDLKDFGLWELYKEGTVYNGTNFEGFPEERRPFRVVEVANLTKEEKKAATEGKKGTQGKVDVKQAEFVENEVQGSNLFIIHGNHTTTGKPMLASDPHLQHVVPAFWYESVLRYEGNYFSGVTIAGSHAFAVGRNKDIAWGITVSYADTADLYTLTTRGDDQYYYDGAWRQMKAFDEVISVKGQKDPIKLTVYETHHGVVLDHYRPGLLIGPLLKPKEGVRHALAWTGYVKNDTLDKWVIQIVQNAKTGQDALDFMSHIVRPSLFLGFACENGDIGFALTGRIPKRRQPLKAMRPQDGSDPANDWMGFIPLEYHPRMINPSKGYIVHGNNKITTDNAKYGGTLTTQIPSRAPRMEEMIKDYIKAGKKISVDDVKTIQSDTLDILARDILPKLLNYIKEAPKSGYKFNITLNNLELLAAPLRAWDYKVTRDSVAASIFNVWQYFFHRKIVDLTGLNETEKQIFQYNHRFDDFVYTNILNPSKPGIDFSEWCVPAHSTEKNHSCVDFVISAFEDTWYYLHEHLGSNVRDWQWGKLHARQFAHSMSQTPLKPIFHRSLPAGGNRRTVAVSGVTQDPEKFDGVWGPTLRFIASMKQGEKSYLVLDTGNSGNPISKHYSDQMALLINDEWLELTTLQEKNWSSVMKIEMKSS